MVLDPIGVFLGGVDMNGGPGRRPKKMDYSRVVKGSMRDLRGGSASNS